MKKICLVWMFLMLFSLQIKADEKIISYFDCIGIALENSPKIKYMKEVEKEVIAEYKKALSYRQVRIDLGLKTTDSSSSGLGISGNSADLGLFAGLTVGYGIVVPGRTLNIEIKKDAISLAKINAKMEINSIIKSVQESYYKYISALNDVDVRENLLEKYIVIYRKKKIEYESGLIRAIDYNRVEITYDSHLLEYEVSKQTLKNSKSELFLNMGISETDNEIEFDEDISIPKIKCSLEELKSIAKILSPEMAILSIKKDMAKKSISMARQKRFPTVSAFLNAGFQNNEMYGMDEYEENFDYTNWSPSIKGGVSFNMPLYDGGAISSDIDKAKSRYNQILYEERQSILMLEQKLKAYYEKLIFSEKQFQIYQKSLVNAKKGIELAEKSYAAGMVDITSVNDASESLLDIESKLLKLKIDYIKTITLIAHLIGVNEEVICLK